MIVNTLLLVLTNRLIDWSILEKSEIRRKTKKNSFEKLQIIKKYTFIYYSLFVLNFVPGTYLHRYVLIKTFYCQGIQSSKTFCIMLAYKTICRIIRYE